MSITAPTDVHRPRYHVVSPANWLNDPNGLIQRGDTWHLFYQYNPHNPRSETKHWGHVSSTDLVHWTHLPVALAPVPDSPDADGVWSGCAVDRGNDVLLMYTGVRIGNDGVERQLPCVATSLDDDLIAWSRHPGNPVIEETPPGLDLVYFRDHTIWREGDAWYMAIASHLRDAGGAALAYRSDNLIDWEYLHPLATGNLEPGDPIWGDSGWECPDFFRLADGRHVLIVSGFGNNLHYVAWLAGDYENQHLTPATRGLVDGGPSFYAPQSFTDNRGRRVMFGWMMERRPVDAQVEAGWSGAMSLPRIVSLDEHGQLVTAPAPENDLLRARELPVTVRDDGATTLAGDTIEILATFHTDRGPVGLGVRTSPDGGETTRIAFDPATRTLSVDTRQASADPAARGALSTLEVPGAGADTVTLRAYLDRSVLEVYVDDRACISDRVYPANPASSGVSVAGAAALVSLRAWEMGNAFAGE